MANNKEEDLNGFAIGVFKTAKPNCFSKFISGAGIFKLTFRILICLAQTCHFVIYNTNQNELDCPY